MSRGGAGRRHMARMRRLIRAALRYNESVIVGCAVSQGRGRAAASRPRSAISEHREVAVATETMAETAAAGCPIGEEAHRDYSDAVMEGYELLDAPAKSMAR